MENLEKELDEISDTALFNPTEVTKLGFIKNTHLVPSAFTLYRLIKSGKIKAVNIGLGKKFPRYFVKGKDLKNFVRERYNLEIIK